MTEEQRTDLLAALREIHDRIHNLYPRDQPMTELDKQTRNQLLVIDLIVHLAEKVIGRSTPNEQLVTEYAANLLYAVRLIAPDYPFDRAAKLLLGDEKDLSN